MAGSIPDPEASREHLQVWKGRIDQLSADTQAMSDRFEGLTKRVSSMLRGRRHLTTVGAEMPSCSAIWIVGTYFPRLGPCMTAWRR